MGFRFTLASVLRFRESIEEREELALKKVEFELARVRRRIDELTQELAKASDERDAALQKSMEAFRLKNWQDEMNASSETKQILVETLATLKSQRDAQMRLYQAARVNRRTLTDLQKQQQGLWEQEQVRIEQKQLDDIFSSRLQRS
jgi:flagellar FliJ protein